jgi:hypothetical protein
MEDEIGGHGATDGRGFHNDVAGGRLERFPQYEESKTPKPCCIKTKSSIILYFQPAGTLEPKLIRPVRWQLSCYKRVFYGLRQK